MAEAREQERGADRARHRRGTEEHRIPPSFGFINARGLERSPDGARALQVWIGSGNPLGNHTYSHLDLTKNSAEDFEKEILRNEPVLELLTPPKAKSDWHWLRYPYLHEGDTLEKRRAVREFLRANNYQVAQTTLDWEDYLWNSAHARCLDKDDAASIEWLRGSYLSEAERWIRVQRISRGRSGAATSTTSRCCISGRSAPPYFRTCSRC
jgi:peptidoglycan/xylan/chitin deacetylase (PgdA/CDA1 family)